MKKIAILMIAATMFVIGGCTDEIQLERGQKLVNIEFYHYSLWYLTRKMNANDVAECYKFQKKSSFGIFEETINICEQE